MRLSHPGLTVVLLGTMPLWTTLLLNRIDTDREPAPAKAAISAALAAEPRPPVAAKPQKPTIETAKAGPELFDRTALARW
mgnify:CR=1 FL=1